MDTLVNKTARVICVDSFILIPGVAEKVRDLQSLLSTYPRFKAMVDAGEIIIQKAKAAKQDDKAQDEQEIRRRAVRKKE